MPRPVLLDPDLDPIAAAGPRRDGYRLRYAIQGPEGACALQRVETDVRYMSGDVTVLRYRGHYWEFFRFGTPAATPAEAQADVHAFGLREDGWTPGDLRRLTRELGIALPLWSAGPTRILCTKRFFLALGETADAEPLVDEPQGAFGYLAEVDGDTSSAEVELVHADEQIPLEPASPLPSGRSPRGTGTFLEASGWRTEERLTCTLASMRTEFDDPGPGYQVGTLGELTQ